MSTKQTVIGLLALTVFAVVFILSPTSGSIGPEEALEFLRNGAAVIDVRSTYEWTMYNMAHKGVLSVPMDSLRSVGGNRFAFFSQSPSGVAPRLVPQIIPDRNKVILIHCLSGSRSSGAEHQLRKMGYSKAYNIGSYNQARSILEKLP